MANRSLSGSNRPPAKLRCAIYTRKSSEEGLEQDFNSLDAQREACEAFIASQKREGWTLVGEIYDDGGFSGATMERPAFQRLLSDVSASKIDVVVVYSQDRRHFRQTCVSFVSVTQQFNTTSSMGRLTLNILLSFAQFEREVTGERIRDKIAASKKKGMWMGGLPSLGYDVPADRDFFDAHGGRMSPTHVNKKGTPYRYYISRSLLEGSTKAKGQGQRIPAAALESLVVRRIRDWLANPAVLLQAVQHAASDAATQNRLVERARHFAAGDHSLGIEGLRTLMCSSLVRVQVHVDRIDITLDPYRVCGCLDETAKQTELIGKAQSAPSRDVVTLSIPAHLKRTGKEMRIIVDDGSEPSTPDTGLVRLLVRANAIRDRLLADRSLTFEDIAKSEGVVPSYATRLFRLTILAPDIVSAILSGKQPPELTARCLMDDTRLPLDWNEQRRRLGFASAH